MPYADELDRYLHVRADRRALRTLRDRYPDEYEQAYRAERATILAAMALKVGSPVTDPTEAPVALELAAPVSVAAYDDPEDQRPEPHAGAEADDPVGGAGESDTHRLDAAVVERPKPDQDTREDVPAVATADGERNSVEHEPERTKAGLRPPIICDVCNEVVPRTGKQGKPRQRHEVCQVRGRVQGSTSLPRGSVSRETSVVEDRPVSQVITLPSPPPVPKQAVSTVRDGYVVRSGSSALPAIAEEPEPVEDAAPTPLYLRDPNGPEDNPEWNVCSRCGYGYNPQTLTCGCQIGVLGDDDAPLDARFRYLGPNDDY